MLAISASFVAQKTATAQQPARSISILSPLAGAQTRARTLSAFVDGGYVVRDTSASVIVTETRAIENVFHLTLRAKLLTVDSNSTRIVLTGEYTIDIMHEEPITVEESTRGNAGEMWDRMAAIGERIRRALASPAG